jgi:hypothetical protein
VHLRSGTASLVTRPKHLETKWWLSPNRVEMPSEFVLHILKPEEQLRQFYGRVSEDLCLLLR